MLSILALDPLNFLNFCIDMNCILYNNIFHLWCEFVLKESSNFNCIILLKHFLLNYWQKENKDLLFAIIDIKFLGKNRIFSFFNQARMSFSNYKVSARKSKHHETMRTQMDTWGNFVIFSHLPPSPSRALYVLCVADSPFPVYRAIIERPSLNITSIINVRGKLHH